MHGPKPPAVELTDAERHELDLLTRRHRSPQQLARRARIILAAADGDNNTQIARRLGLDVDTVRAWRQRWLALRAVASEDLSVSERLVDAPGRGRKSSVTAEQLCKIEALACEAPTRSGRPISQWSGQEIADEIVARDILPQVSRRQAARLLKKTISSPTSSATGSRRPTTSSSTPK